MEKLVYLRLPAQMCKNTCNYNNNTNKIMTKNYSAPEVKIVAFHLEGSIMTGSTLWDLEGSTGEDATMVEVTGWSW